MSLQSARAPVQAAYVCQGLSARWSALIGARDPAFRLWYAPGAALLQLANAGKQYVTLSAALCLIRRGRLRADYLHCASLVAPFKACRLLSSKICASPSRAHEESVFNYKLRRVHRRLEKRRLLPLTERITQRTRVIHRLCAPSPRDASSHSNARAARIRGS